MATVLRGIAYCGIVFGVGFVLGTVRVLWLVPRVGERTAELMEAPLMLVAIVCSARFVVRRFPATWALDLAVSGGLALTVLLAIEFSVVLGLRDISVSQYLSERDPLAGGLYVAMLLVFAAMPWLVGRRHAD